MLGFVWRRNSKIKEKCVKITSLLTAGALAVVMASPAVVAADQMAPEQQKEIEKIVHDYLVSNPEVLVEVSQALQQKQQQNAQQQAKAGILENATQLFSGTLAVAGNPKGNVTMVEFFDYQCIHCKKMAPVINELIKKDNNLTDSIIYNTVYSPIFSLLNNNNQIILKIYKKLHCFDSISEKEYNFLVIYYNTNGFKEIIYTYNITIYGWTSDLEINIDYIK